MAQAETENTIKYYVSSETESFKIYDLLKSKLGKMNFEFVDLKKPCNEYFGFLNF